MSYVLTADRFRGLFEHAPLGIIHLTRDATVLEVNHAGLVLGVAAGESFLGFGRAAARDLIGQFIRETIDHGHTDSMSLEWPLVEGSSHWFDIYGTPMPSTGGAVATLIAMVFDSTENHLNLGRLRDSESLLAGVMDFAPLAIAIEDTTGRYLRFNPTAEKAYGFTSVEAKGASPHDFYPPEIAEALLAHDRAVVESKQPTERQQIVSTPEGERLISSLKFPLFNDASKVTAVCSISTDLTEKREVETKLEEGEQRFRDFANIAADWFWEMDADYRFTYQSERFEGITGIPVDQVLGRTRDEAFSGRIDSDEKWTRQISSMESHLPYEMEWEIKNSNGELRTLRTIGRPRFDEQGTFQGYRGVGEDVTAVRQSEREREGLIAELETKNAELEQFSYTVSHDLKSPLLTIKGFLGLLERDVESGDMQMVRADLGRIRNAADRMQVLLRDLLKLSQVGRIGGPDEIVNLQMVVAEVMDTLAGTIDDQIELRIAPSLPIVRGDRTRLVQVFQNLLENALKFLGDQPKPVVEIGHTEVGELVTLFVRDNGIGIEPRYHERIFSLFERLDSAGDGTGVGLALSKRIIEHHGGQIWVDSPGQPQAGTTFSFTLPHARAAA